MTLSDRLAQLTEPGTNTPQVRSAAPSGWEPGVRFEPDGSRVVTLPPSPQLEDESSWAAAVEALGVSVPDGYRVRLVEARFDPASWQRDAQGEDAVTRPVWRYRFVVEVAPTRIDVDDLLRSARVRKSPPSPSSGAAAFVFAAGDLQLGKPDGDGTAGTVERFFESLDRALSRYKRLRKAGQAGPVALVWVGDCIEGSQAASPITRADLTLTEQVRVYRRLMLEQVSAFVGVEERVTVAVVPGNHDDALRLGQGPAYRYDDSWAIEGASQVADVMAAKGVDVSWIFPDRDRMTVCFDASGTRIGVLHGHQTRGKMKEWLANRALSRDAIGTSDLVLSGHYHTLRVEHLASTTWMQTGALDGGSVWWTERGGLPSPPAALTLLTEGGRWHGLEVV